MTQQPDTARLLPELQAWNDGKGISIDSWLSCIGRFDHAIAYASLFWPDFVLHGEYLLIGKPDPEYFAQWIVTCDGNKTAVESLLNHRHLTDLFANSPEQPSIAVLDHLGQRLKEMWQCKLARDFPNLPARVEYHGAECADMGEHVITVYIQRDQAEPPRHDR